MSPKMKMPYRPLLILVYADSAHAARCGRHFRRLGWEVRLAASAAEGRRLTSTSAARAIVLDTELPDESGWLTCAKITQEDPTRKVILMAPDRLAETRERLARVGAAALVSRQDDLEALADSILGREWAEAV